MKNQALFSSKDKSIKLKCHLLQFLFGVLRVKTLLIFYFYLSKKIRLDFSCNLKHQVLFSLKNNEKVFMYVVCCSRDWRFKG